MGVKCFWLEPTRTVRRELRRYVSSARGGRCPGPLGYHDAETFIDVVPGIFDERGFLTELPAGDFAGDPRWPMQCSCGYVFKPEDERQVFTSPLYRRADTGDEMTLRDAPPGAMWDAWWYGEWSPGPDGKHLIVKCPNGHEWFIDGPASNCTMKYDHVHRCWVRHGEPPLITVDKNGLTCAAGAGSIQAGDYHGFLRNGEFT